MGVAVDDRRKHREAMAERRARDRDIPARDIADAKRRELCQEDDERWLRTYISSAFFRPFTSDQKRMIETIGECLRYGLTRCIAAARGDGKTSIARFLTLKYALPLLSGLPQVRCTLLISATGPNATFSLNYIKRELATPGSPLWEDYPFEVDVCQYVDGWASRAKSCTVGMRPVFVEWQKSHLVLPTYREDHRVGGVLASMGITSNEIQGFNRYGVRPAFVLLDDLDDRESTATDRGTMAEKYERIIDTNIAGLGGTGESLGTVMLCTIPSRNSVAFRYSDPQQKPGWGGQRLRRIIDWPDGSAMELWSEYIAEKHRGQQEFGDDGRPIDPLGRSAFAMYEANREAMDRGAVLNNDDAYDKKEQPDGNPKQISALQHCFDYIAEKGMPSFLTEYQNDPPADEAPQKLTINAHMVMSRISGLDQKKVPPIEPMKITCALDVGKMWGHWVKIAWHGNAIGNIIDYGVLEMPGVTVETSPARVREVLLQALQQWRIDMIAEHPPDFALIDSGDYSDAVYEFIRQVGSPFAACKGPSRFSLGVASSDRMLFEECFATRQKEENLWLYFPNTEHWKHRVHEMFVTPTFNDLQQMQAGSLSLYVPTSRQTHNTFAHHIVAEGREETFEEKKGWSRKWITYSQNNHYLDATSYACCAAGVIGVRLVQKQSPVETPQDVKAQKKRREAPKAPNRFKTRPGGWVPRRR